MATTTTRVRNLSAWRALFRRVERCRGADEWAHLCEQVAALGTPAAGALAIAIDTVEVNRTIYELDRGYQVGWGPGAVVLSRRVDDHYREAADLLLAEVRQNGDLESATAAAHAWLTKLIDEEMLEDRDADALHSALSHFAGEFNDLTPTLVVCARRRPAAAAACAIWGPVGHGTGPWAAVVPACVTHTSGLISAGAVDPALAGDSELLDVTARMWSPQDYGALSHPTDAYLAARALLGRDN